MSLLVGIARRMGWRLVAGSLLALGSLPWPAWAQSLTLTQAQRLTAGAAADVKLPDTLLLAHGEPPPLKATYRMSVRLDPVPRRPVIFIPALSAHARIRVNGHLVDDRLDDPLAPLPRSYAAIRLVDVPAEFTRRGVNTIEIEAAAQRRLSLSTIEVGSRDALGRRYDARLLGAVAGPALVAVVVASLGLCVLLLWARRGDPLYGYFGLGALGLGLHNAWSLLPQPLLPGMHNIVWWSSLYTAFVAMLVIFCVRFAGWRWLRFDRTLCTLALLGPALLYAADAAGAFEQAQEIWFLGWIGIVGVGVAAVVRYAWQHRNVDGALLMLTGAVSLAFAVRDWVVNHRANDPNPVFLVPYAGLLFVFLVAWMLIDRFVTASRELEAVNRELESRVSSKSAQLGTALNQMRAAKDSAEAANRSKTTFLAAASHDLRQPVHALGLYLAALVEEELGPEQRDLVHRMKASLAALDTMFNALLDISRMDAGAVVPRPRPFALEPMLHRVAEESAALAASKGLRLSVRLAPATRRLQALSDPVLVERVVRNLLGNAVKYTEAGGVLLTCRLRGGPHGHWRIEVWDTGAGIAEADRERVFEEFYQVGNPERDRASGLGLGLSIVRRLTDLLGLRLSLFSQPGRGTRFALELPCTEDAASGWATGPGAGTIEGVAVAVIDDDREVRDGMQILLERWGCSVFAGADAREVLQREESPSLQIVIADLRLRGGRTGIDEIRVLHEACGRRLPALIVSGDSSPEQLAMMQASGFAWMSKPVRPERLCAWVSAAALEARAGLSPSPRLQANA